MRADMTDLESIKNTLVNISKGNGVLDMLMEFERTLDNAEVFAYKNWIMGELVEGPDIGRYWFRVVLMFPHALMPDPDGGLRLTKLGAKVNFRKGIFKKPVKVRGPQDWIDPESKRAKIAEHKIWLVTIELPIKYINRGLEDNDDKIRKDIEDTNEELADAFEDDISTQNDGLGEMGGEMGTGTDDMQMPEPGEQQ